MGHIGNIKIIRDRSLAPNKVWRRKREAIDVKQQRFGLGAAIAGLTGTTFALIQNELLLQGTDPQSRVMDMLKATNSLCSVATVACVFNIYWLNILFNRVQVGKESLHLFPAVFATLILGSGEDKKNHLSGPSTLGREPGTWNPQTHTRTWTAVVVHVERD